MILTTVIKWVSLHNSMSLEVTENKARWLGWDEVTGYLTSHTEEADDF